MSFGREMLEKEDNTACHKFYCGPSEYQSEGPKNGAESIHGPSLNSEKVIAELLEEGPSPDNEDGLLFGHPVVDSVKDGKALFDKGFRICKVCGVMANQHHRDVCDAELEEDLFEDFGLGSSELQIFITRINNGFIVSTGLEGDTYLKDRTAVLGLITKKLRKLKKDA